MKLRRLLLPTSWLYGAVMALRNLWYDWKEAKVFHAPVPVISVGNLSTGGTGKTPVAEFLLHYFGEAHGVKPAYLSRGYGRRTRGYRLVPATQGTARDYGDEALQVAHKFPDLPVAVCEDRREGIRRLIQEENAQLIILDDAFQHRKVARDLDLVLLDAARLPQQDAVLPAGNLREPRRGLARADFLVVNKLAEPESISRIRQDLARWQKPLAFAVPVFDRLIGFGQKEGQVFSPGSPLACVAFAGLGNNAFFFRQLEQAGIEVWDSFSFPDHYAYREQDLARIVECYRQHKEKKPNFASLLVLTTEKDYFRLRGGGWLDHYDNYPFFYLSIKLHWWEGKAELLRQLDTLAGRASSFRAK